MAETTLWERKRLDARAEITETALQLFVSQGFDETTIEQIVSEAGISRRTFFRYFGTKEDVVMGDLIARGNALRDALEARPASEDPWAALRASFASMGDPSEATESVLARSRLFLSTPALRARHLEKHARWQELLAPSIERRLGLASGPVADPRALAIVASALACFDIALDTWTRRNGVGDPAEIYDQAIAAVRG